MSPLAAAARALLLLLLAEEEVVLTPPEQDTRTTSINLKRSSVRAVAAVHADQNHATHHCRRPAETLQPMYEGTKPILMKLC